MELSDREFRQWKETHKEDVEVTSIAYSAGGIWPCIVGTALLVVGSMILALFIGISAAIYLSEYSRETRLIRFIRIAILNLAGVPSIVFGLFGFGLFVIFFGWNVSLIAGWFTLGLMILPAIITASEESLRAVPQGLREGSLALGATKWQTIRKNVLPYAVPGILTSSILGIARVAGETAPIMFTAAYAMRDEMPWQVSKWTDFFFQGVMALPYHIYVVSSKIPQNEYTERVQYGAAFVFLILVMLIALTSIVLREKQRRRLSW
jgi:phosphate transport system permease protein